MFKDDTLLPPPYTDNLFITFINSQLANNAL